MITLHIDLINELMSHLNGVVEKIWPVDSFEELLICVSNRKLHSDNSYLHLIDIRRIRWVGKWNKPIHNLSLMWVGEGCIKYAFKNSEDLYVRSIVFLDAFTIDNSYEDPYIMDTRLLLEKVGIRGNIHYKSAGLKAHELNMDEVIKNQLLNEEIAELMDRWFTY